MPSTGMPSSSSSLRSAGASSAYTEAGPPERTRPRGPRSRIRSRSMSCGRSSLKTPHSRIRRAISWEYWPPKSRTRTSSVAWAGANFSTSRSSGSAPGTLRSGTWTRPGFFLVAALAASVIADCDRDVDGRATVRPHPDCLLALELLALGLEGRCDHHLGAVELRDVLVAGRGHRGAERAHQVERAVIVLGGAEQDLLERAVLLGRDAGASRQRRMEGRHPPVRAAARSLLGAGERRADHDRVRSDGDRLGDIAASPHAAVRDHVAVVPRLHHVLAAGRGHVGDRGGLRHADPEDAPGRARGAGANADQDAHGAGPHQVKAGVVGGTAADHARDVERGDELLQVEGLGLGGDVLRRDHGSLDHEDVEPRLEGDVVVLGHLLRSERAADHRALGLDLLDPPGDQLGLDRLRVDLLHHPSRDLVGSGRDLVELRVGVLVAGPDPLQVEHAKPAELADQAGGLRADHAVHRGGEQRKLKPVGTEVPGDVDVVGVASPPRGDDRDVIEAVCPAAFLAAADLYFHWLILSSFADEKTPRRGAGNALLAAFRKSFTNAPPRITAVNRDSGG